MEKKPVTKRVIIVLTLCLSMAGCDNQAKIEETKNFITQTAQQSMVNAQKVELLQFKHEEVTYNPKNTRDPFQTPSEATLIQRNLQGTILLQYSINSLTLIGVLEQGPRLWGLIKAPDNHLYKIKIGDRVGNTGAVVTHISQDQVTFVEQIKTSSGMNDHVVKLTLAGQKP